MEKDSSNKYLDKSNDECLKTESDSSNSLKRKVNNDCPLLTLPDDILVKIILQIPVAQWPSLELLADQNFRDTILRAAWQKLRCVNVDQDFLIKKTEAHVSFRTFMQNLVERSPFLTSISGIDSQMIESPQSSSCVCFLRRTICWRRVNADLISDATSSLAQFEHLQSITMGEMEVFLGQREILLLAAVEFLETTRSRTSLKEVRLSNVVLQQHHQRDRVALLDRLASSFSNGRGMQLPLKLEKFSFASSDHSLRIRLDTMDTTRLAVLRLGQASIEPAQLANVIGRASNLRLIHLSFSPCHVDCNGQYLQANKNILTALACHENLTAIKFDCAYQSCDTKCMNFGFDFISMLVSIGRRGKLRKLALNPFFALTPTIRMGEVCMTICNHIPNLRSIKLFTDGINHGSLLDIVSLTGLEEIYLHNLSTRVAADSMNKITQLSHLKRLAVNKFSDDDSEWLKCLANSITLMDLRIGCGRAIRADVFEKWSDGFASNLRVLMLGEIAEDDEHDEAGLVRFLEKAVRLRTVILAGRLTDRSLTAIAKSCPELEILIIITDWIKIPIAHLQAIVDGCPKMKKLGGFGDEIRSRLQIPKYRRIGEAKTGFWNYDFDDSEDD